MNLQAYNMPATYDKKSILDTTFDTKPVVTISFSTKYFWKDSKTTRRRVHYEYGKNLPSVDGMYILLNWSRKAFAFLISYGQQTSILEASEWFKWQEKNLDVKDQYGLKFLCDHDDAIIQFFDETQRSESRFRTSRTTSNGRWDLCVERRPQWDRDEEVFGPSLSGARGLNAQSSTNRCFLHVLGTKRLARFQSFRRVIERETSWYLT